MAAPVEELEVQGRPIRVTNPGKVYFPAAPGGPLTKLDVVRYWAEVADAALHGCRDRPVDPAPLPRRRDRRGLLPEATAKGGARLGGDGADHLPQRAHGADAGDGRRRAPGRAATLGCLELNPWPVRGDDVDHPDELRDRPGPGAWRYLRARCATSPWWSETCSQSTASGFPKTPARGASTSTCGSSRAGLPRRPPRALALAREIERRVPGIATAAWWKEERLGVFMDYNQNARDRTVASAYSCGPYPTRACRRRWTGSSWGTWTFGFHGQDRARAATHHGRSRPRHRRARGEARSAAGSVGRDEARGVGDAPWPPTSPRQPVSRRAWRPAGAGLSPTRPAMKAPTGRADRTRSPPGRGPHASEGTSPHAGSVRMQTIEVNSHTSTGVNRTHEGLFRGPSARPAGRPATLEAVAALQGPEGLQDRGAPSP